MSELLPEDGFAPNVDPKKGDEVLAESRTAKRISPSEEQLDIHNATDWWKTRREPVFRERGQGSFGSVIDKAMRRASGQVEDERVGRLDRLLVTALDAEYDPDKDYSNPVQMSQTVNELENYIGLLKRQNSQAESFLYGLQLMLRYKLGRDVPRDEVLKELGKLLDIKPGFNPYE